MKADDRARAARRLQHDLDRLEDAGNHRLVDALRLELRRQIGRRNNAGRLLGPRDEIDR